MPFDAVGNGVLDREAKIGARADALVASSGLAARAGGSSSPDCASQADGHQRARQSDWESPCSPRGRMTYAVALPFDDSPEKFPCSDTRGSACVHSDGYRRPGTNARHWRSGGMKMVTWRHLVRATSERILAEQELAALLERAEKLKVTKARLPDGHSGAA